MRESDYKRELYERHRKLTRTVLEKIREEDIKFPVENENIRNRFEDEIGKLPEFKACIDWISRDPVLKQFERMGIYEFDYSFHEFHLLYFLERLCMKSAKFVPPLFDEMYEKRKDCICPEKREYKIIGCSTRSFEYDGEEIDLGNGLKIRKINNEEAVTVRDEIEKLSLGKYVLEIRGKCRCSLQPDTRPQSDFQRERNHLLCLYAERVCQKILWAMKLFKAGDVNIRTLSLFWPSVSLGSYGLDTHFRDNPFVGRTVYKVSQEEAVEFRNFWHKYQELMEKSELTIPLKRFGYTYERVRPEDKLIDCIVGLESLIFKEKEADSRKFGKRILKASRLKPPKEEPKLIYELRDKILHGYRSRQIKEKLKKLEEINNRKITSSLSNSQIEGLLETYTSKATIYLKETLKEAMHYLSENSSKGIYDFIDYLRKKE